MDAYPSGTTKRPSAYRWLTRAPIPATSRCLAHGSHRACPSRTATAEMTRALCCAVLDIASKGAGRRRHPVLRVPGPLHHPAHSLPFLPAYPPFSSMLRTDVHPRASSDCVNAVRTPGFFSGPPATGAGKNAGGEQPGTASRLGKTRRQAPGAHTDWQRPNADTQPTHPGRERHRWDPRTTPGETPWRQESDNLKADRGRLFPHRSPATSTLHTRADRLMYECPWLSGHLRWQRYPAPVLRPATAIAFPPDLQCAESGMHRSLQEVSPAAGHPAFQRQQVYSQRWLQTEGFWRSIESERVADNQLNTLARIYSPFAHQRCEPGDRAPARAGCARHIPLSKHHPLPALSRYRPERNAECVQQSSGIPTTRARQETSELMSSQGVLRPGRFLWQAFLPHPGASASMRGLHITWHSAPPLYTPNGSHLENLASLFPEKEIPWTHTHPALCCARKPRNG